jgi:small subunit ribosomal protein S6
MPDPKHLYETTFIINASIEDSQIEALVSHAKEIITSNGGEVTALNTWGRKRLAYVIDKKNNGYYVNIEFRAPGTVIARLEHMFHLDENVLRFLTIHLDKKALKARDHSMKIAATAARMLPCRTCSCRTSPPAVPAAPESAAFTEPEEAPKA